MPVTTEKLHDQPIIVSRLQGRFSAREADVLLHQCVDMADGIDGPVYHITDLTDAEISLLDMPVVVNTLRAEVPGSTADPRFINVFIGNARTSRLYADIFRKQISDGLPFFTDVDSALAYIGAQSA